LLCFDKDLLGPFIANKLNMVWTPENSTTIGWVTDEIEAVVWYEDFNKKSVTCHIYLEKGLNRQYLHTIFDYPFVQLGVEKVIGPVNSSNLDALKLDKHFGFEEEARIKGAYPDGDLVLLTLTKDKCKFLGEKYGRKRRR
jgi:RimJ/RimL family protein N-acetyltransferase